jgi:hypothetical protein
MDKEGKKGVNQSFSIVKALLSSKTVSYKRDICAIMTVSSGYKHVMGKFDKQEIKSLFV